MKDITLTKPTSAKVELIIHAALELLRERGDQGLTMRQVAKQTGMSLSNVQYYFKNKNDLLMGMVDFYLVKCSEIIQEKLAGSTAVTNQQKIHEIVELGINLENHYAGICKTFTELWAIANRNPKIKSHLEGYYVAYADELSKILSPMSVKQESIPIIVNLLLPYFEGYAILANAMPLNREQTIDMMTDIVMSILRND